MTNPTQHSFYSTASLDKNLRGAVVAIGNFDGVHLGHRKVLQTTLKLAKEKNVPALVLTFEPHPRTWFNPDQPVFRLNTAEDKADLLLALGFDGVVAESFDEDFASTNAIDFIQHHLVNDLNVSHVVTGFNFHFGAKRSGTPEVLVAQGEKLGFGVTLVGAVEDGENTTVSSSLIRQALSDGDIKTANQLLDRDWKVTGTVVQGAQLGRTLGFPTANIKLPEETKLRHGIYAVLITGAGKKYLHGVASFGRRPTFDNGAPLLETFIFDFDEDIYGEEITISFVDWIRKELKFDDADALVEQMKKDTATAKQILKNHHYGS